MIAGVWRIGMGAVSELCGKDGVVLFACLRQDCALLFWGMVVGMLA